LSALILCLAIFLLPLFVREFRRNARLILTYWFLIILHQGVAFTNAFLFPTLGTGSDAGRFHLTGLELSALRNFSPFFYYDTYYESFLATCYWLLGPSMILGSQFSILVFALSCIILIKMLHLMELGRYETLTLFVFGALPSMVLIGSVTMRESYQVFFFMLTVYFGMKIHTRETKKINFLLMLVSLLILRSFHSALLNYSAFLIVLLILWNPYPTSGLLRVKKKHLILMLSLLILFVGVFVLTKMGLTGLGSISLLKANPFELISKFRMNATISRASYGITFDYSSLFSITSSSFLIYVSYLFAPFPWQVETLLDVCALIESILRGILIYFSVKHWRSAHGLKRQLLGLMLVLYFSISFMWSMGTTNYGTAIRHNLLSWWILAIVGIPSLMKILNHFWFNSILHRRSYSLADDRE
jgi:hypothetical protein